LRQAGASRAIFGDFIGLSSSLVYIATHKIVARADARIPRVMGGRPFDRCVAWR
jgi:hypothetical protein